MAIHLAFTCLKVPFGQVTSEEICPSKQKSIEVARQNYVTCEQKLHWSTSYKKTTPTEKEEKKEDKIINNKKLSW